MVSGESLFIPGSLQSLSAKTNSTLILGVEVGKAFRDSGNQQKFVGLTGTYGRDKQLGIQGTRTPFPVPDPLPVGWRTWQADHIVDLGFFVTIAKQSVPKDINKDDWQKITDAIIGDEDASPSST